MDDLISRQDAIKAFDCTDELIVSGSANAQNVTNYINKVIGKIQAQPSAQPEQWWIPCSERLPEDYKDVLVYFEYYRYGDYDCMFSTYGIGSYSGEYDSWLVNSETGWHKLHVFAWMPLPEPYKGEEHGEGEQRRTGKA